MNGQLADEGVGEAVMGNPVRSVVWLANKLAQFGRHLEAEQLVMTGSLTPKLAIHQGDVVTATFEPLGRVTASFV